MKRSFPPPALVARRVLVACSLLCGVACAPNNGVKPGAPELIEFNIIEAVPGGGVETMITPDTPECATIATGDACLPMGKPADAADGGTNTMDIPPDTVCRLASAMNWCRCQTPDPMNAPTVGVWDCDPFANVLPVVAVFDRVLDTAPLDPGDAAGLTDVVTATAGSSPTTVDLLTDYSPTGASNGVVFNVFGPAFFGNYRGDGPSLLSAPQPEFPSGTTVTVSLDAGKILAKDGTTPFKAGGLLMSNSVTFTMAPFSASVSLPDAMAMDPTAVTVAFTNFVEAAACPTKDPMDPTKIIMACASASHISATANGVPIAIAVASGGGASGATVTVTPDGGAWPTGEMITITVDAASQNLLKQTITTAATGMFTAP